MAEQKFYDMADTAEDIDRVIHDLVEVTTEENDGKVLMVEKVVDEETEEVSVNITEADLPVLEGNENEIVVFDGENWGKQSGLYVETEKKSLYDTTGFHSFRVKPSVDNAGTMVINGIIITDITDPENETIIYDMQSDPNFSSLSNSSSPLFTPNSFTISTEPENSITLPWTGSSDRYLGIRSLLFNRSKIYRIFVNLANSSGLGLGYWLSIYGNNRDHHLEATSGTSIVYEIPRAYSKDYQIFGTGGTENTQILISGKRSLQNTCFLAMSGTTRHTMHDNAKFDMGGESTMYIHDESRFDMSDSARVHIHGKALLNMDHASRLHMHGNSEVGINDGSRFWMSGDDSGSPDVAFNGDCKFSMNGDDNAPDKVRLTWSDPILIANKTQLMYCGSHSNVKDMGTPDNPTPYPFLSLERAKVMIGGPKYDDPDPTHGSKFWSSYPKFDGFKINGSYASDIVITSLIVTDITDANNLEIIYNMQEDTEFENISTSSSPLFTSGTFTISTSPNAITFPAVASQTLGKSRFLGIRKNLFDTSRRYKINIICTPTTGTRSLNYIRDDGEVFATYLIGGASDLNYTMPEKDIESSTWIKIGTEEGNVQVHVLNNSFLQMSGNSHSEMHNDSFFIMKNRPENSVLESKARDLYESTTGLLWENLTEEEKLPWYKKADNGHEKVEGSPFFQMVNDCSIDLDDGIDITGDSTGLYLNNEKIATEYSYETEEEGETILNTVNIETLFTELQSALARIAELEETIQTLNS